MSLFSQSIRSRLGFLVVGGATVATLICCHGSVPRWRDVIYADAARDSRTTVPSSSSAWNRLETNLAKARASLKESGITGSRNVEEAIVSTQFPSGSVEFSLQNGADAYEVLLEATQGESHDEHDTESESQLQRHPWWKCSVERSPSGSVWVMERIMDSPDKVDFTSKENENREFYPMNATRTLKMRKSVSIPGLQAAFPSTLSYHTDDIASLTDGEANALVGAYILAQIPSLDETMTLPERKTIQTPQRDYPGQSVEDRIERLESLGASVVAPGDPDPLHRETINWRDFAGSESIRDKLEEALTLYVDHPEVYQAITNQTRVRSVRSNRPRAVLFEGPPGCGKTTAAKILAAQANVFFVHVPLESIVSKWYGEAEKRLSEIINTARVLGQNTLIFLDEVDALAPSRDHQVSLHEASRRMLSVLLRMIDGMDGPSSSCIFIAATNRKSDLDPALLSRFSLSIVFPLPDEQGRMEILGLYAKHLTESERRELAKCSPSLSGRDLFDACQDAERTCAGRQIRSRNFQKHENTDNVELPSFQDYLDALGNRRLAVQGSQKSK